MIFPILISFVVVLLLLFCGKGQRSVFLQRFFRGTFLLLSFVFIFIQPAQGEELLTFGVYTSDKPSAMVRQFRPLLDLIESKMGRQMHQQVKIKLRVARTYDLGIADIVQGKVDLSRLGPVSYVSAKKQNDGLSILAIESKRGTKTFLGVICVSKDSNIFKVEDLRGKSFAFGNELSTIGRYLAQSYLFEHGIRAGDLSRYEYLDRHDMVGAAVAAHQFDAGALKESTFRKIVAKGGRLKVIAEFPNVTKPWVARRGLDPKIKRALKEVLLGIKDEKVLIPLGKDGFMSGNDNDYLKVRKAMEENHLFFETGK